jgi:hypothetical protein
MASSSEQLQEWRRARLPPPGLERRSLEAQIEDESHDELFDAFGRYWERWAGSHKGYVQLEVDQSLPEADIDPLCDVRWDMSLCSSMSAFEVMRDLNFGNSTFSRVKFDLKSPVY